MKDLDKQPRGGLPKHDGKATLRHWLIFIACAGAGILIISLLIG